MENETDREALNEHHHHQKMKVVLIVLGVVAVAVILTAGHFHERRSVAMRRGFVVGAYPGGYGRGSLNGGMGRGGGGTGMRHGHGISGSISSINGNTVTVKTTTGDVSVSVADTTSIYTATAVAKLADLKVGSNVVVQGRPGSNGVVNAVVIRIVS